MSTLLITDSTSYLPENIVAEYGINVVALNVHLPEQDFKEGEGLSNYEYYQYLRNNRVFPTTSQPAAGEFLEIFKKLQTGDEALVILISSQLSGTLQSAQIASSMLPSDHPPVTIIDSLSTAMGLGFQVIQAAEMLASGSKVNEIKPEIEEMRQVMQVFFMVDDLEHLARSGRISTLNGFLGNILKLKPILTVRAGKIVLFEKVRTAGKAIQRMLEEVEKHRQSLHKISVLHADDLKAAQRLQAKLQSDYAVPVYLIEAGPVIGTHVGPGCLGIIFY